VSPALAVDMEVDAAALALREGGSMKVYVLTGLFVPASPIRPRPG
jgi:hypothetical protein